MSKAYLAGIVDGEGTISLHSVYKGPEYCFPFVQISNTNHKLEQWVKERVDIPYGYYEYNRNPNKQKPCFLFQFRGSNAVTLLKMILPYLVLKREQADIVLDTWEGSARWNGSKRGHWCSKYPMPPEIKEKRTQALRNVQALNRKGPPKGVINVQNAVL